MTGRSATTTTTVGAYLLARLREAGADHLFGVPGDYNLGLLDLVADSGLAWVGNAGELGAGYAADGYARMRGFAAVAVTYGVGELSAINAVAGSYAESVPVALIVGAPATDAVAAGRLLHHTLADGDFDRFGRMYAEVTAAGVVLTADDAARQIDETLRTCLTRKRPVRIAVPVDVVRAVVAAPDGPLLAPERPAGAGADPAVAAAFRAHAATLLAAADSVAVLADHLADRHGARGALAGLSAAGRLPVAVVPMGKGVVDETLPEYVGIYSGARGAPAVRELVEGAGCLITVGVVLHDANTGGFSHRFPDGATIAVDAFATRVGTADYALTMADALAVLTELVAGGTVRQSGGRVAAPAPYPSPAHDAAHAPLTHAALWPLLADRLRPGDVILADQGTAAFGANALPLPADARVLTQPLWASIGYTLPAVLGTALAAPERRHLLLIGDGACQLTAAEIGTIARAGARPLVLVLDNGGYAIEDAIHPTTADYNTVAPWDHTLLPAAFGVAEHWTTATVRTPAELSQALDAAERSPDRAGLVRLILRRDDYPPGLAEIAARKRG